MAGSEVGGRISTRVDELIKLIVARPQISSADAAKQLNVDQEMVESWARFLEKAGDIRIAYRGLTPTFIAVKQQPAGQAEPTEPHREKSKKTQTTIGELHRAIQEQVSAITQAISHKTYEGIKPSIEAVRGQLERIRKRIEAASVEAKDKKAISAALDKVSSRIDSIEQGASKQSFFKLKSDARHLSREVKSLGKQLPESPVAPPAPPETSEPTSKKAKSASEPGPAAQDASDDAGIEGRIDELERQVREAVESGDVDRAETLYAELQRLYDRTLPQRYEQIRSHLKNQIYTIRKDIAFASDESTRRAFERQHAQLVELIERYERAMGEQDWNALEDLERGIVETYNALPIGFEDEKKRLEERFGALIVEAAKQRRSGLTERIDKLHQTMSQTEQAMNDAIGKGDFTSAQQAYRQLRSLIDEVPSQLVIERIDMQTELLSQFERLTSAFKERFIATNESRIERCTHLIESIKTAMHEGRLDDAGTDYEHALSELELVDHNYFEQRSRLQYDLMRAHKDLLDLKAHNAESRFEQLAGSFQQILTDGRNYIVHGETELAESIYLKLLDLYRRLPSGHEERKKALKDQIFDYYKSLMTMDTTGEVPDEDIDRILERLVAIHHALNTGDPSGLGADLTRVEQLVDALPDSFRKRNPALDRELTRLVHLRRIYDGIIRYSAALDQGMPSSDVASFIETSEAWLEHESVSASSLLMMLRVLRSRYESLIAARRGPAATPPQAQPRPPARAERTRRTRPARSASPEKQQTKAGLAHPARTEPAPEAEATVPGTDHPISDIASRIDTIKSLLKE